MSKIIVPRQEIVELAWNQSLPNPLGKGEYVIIHDDQSNIDNPEKYIRVKHGKGAVSIFDRAHFMSLKVWQVKRKVAEKKSVDAAMN